MTALKSEKKSRVKDDTKYSAIFNCSMDAILITAPDGRILSANPAACLMFGWTEKEIVELGSNRLVDHSDKRFSRLLKERDKNGSAKGELTFLRKNDSSFFGEVSTALFRDRNRQFSTIMVIRDITERKQVEIKLRKSEDRFKQVAVSTGEWIWEVDTDGLYTYVNSLSESLLGYNPEEIVGKKHFYDFYSPEFRDELINTAFDVFAGKKTFSKFENSNLHKNGHTVIFETSGFPILDEYGNLHGYRGANTDISARKRTEDSLRRANQYNRSLLEASLDALVTIGPDGKIMDVNNATQEIIGYSRTDLIGAAFSNYFTDPAKAQAGYKEAFLTGSVSDYSLDIKNKNGDIIPVLFNATVYHDETGKVSGVFAAARDITELKKAQEKLNQTTKELRQLTQHLVEVRENERTQIAHDLHDDLGQKLTALNMDIAWLKSRIGVRSSAVEQKLNDMINLLNDTIDRTKKISFGLRPSILDDLGLRSAISWQLADFSRSTGIRPRVNYSSKEIQVDRNISLIVFRIIQEALTNVTRHSKATEVFLKLWTSKRKLNLKFIDNGIGIADDQITGPKSFGIIGMKERVKSCGGELLINGVSGKGTEINMIIPLKKTGS